ncbi:PHP domain-containing protein [Romeriopsis navalis]|nr:PHP domain-containing protein [Romeriopsis navalis]
MAYQKPAAQDLVSLRQVFATIDAASCPHAFNFHMHTQHSDGQLDPQALAQQALDLGLKGFAITDHHQISGFYAAQAYLIESQQQHPDQSVPQLWTGVEINATLLDVVVHILGYGFNPHHPAMADYLLGEAPTGAMAEADRVVSAIHQAGGLVILAHPARYRKSYEELIPAAVAIGINGVETYYAYGNPKPWEPSPDKTAAVQAISQRYQLLNTCGTDTHGISLEQRV